MASCTQRSAVRCAATAVLALVAPVLAGCGGSGKGDVSGKITYNGQTLPYGSVQFMSPGGAFVSMIESDGSYSIKGVAAGISKISITCQDPKYAEFMKQLSESARNPKVPKPKGNPEDFDKIPSKFTNPESSGLTYTVKSGSQTFDIELK